MLSIVRWHLVSSWWFIDKPRQCKGQNKCVGGGCSVLCVIVNLTRRTKSAHMFQFFTRVPRQPQPMAKSHSNDAEWPSLIGPRHFGAHVLRKFNWCGLNSGVKCRAYWLKQMAQERFRIRIGGMQKSAPTKNEHDTRTAPGSRRCSISTEFRHCVDQFLTG